MMQVQPTGQGLEEAALEAPAARRTGRGSGRAGTVLHGASPFRAQLLQAAGASLDPAGAGRPNQSDDPSAGNPSRDGDGREAGMSPDPRMLVDAFAIPTPAGSAAMPRPAEPDPDGSVPLPPDPAGPVSRSSEPPVAAAVPVTVDAATPFAPATEPGTADRREPPSAGPTAAPVGAEQPKAEAGHRLTADAELEAVAAVSPQPAPAAAGRAPDRGLRTDLAQQGPMLPGFRLETASGPRGPATGPQGRTAPEPMVEAAMPADILVARAGPEDSALAVTIAAATADLRDRLRSGTDELRADLAAIGTEVDAIRVELRGELADGGGGTGAHQDAGPRGDIGQSEQGWGEPDATARLQMADLSAGAELDQAALPADREGSGDPGPDVGPEPGNAGDPDAGAGRRDGRAGSGPAGDAGWLRLVPLADAGPRAPDLRVPAGGSDSGARVDRYA